MHIICISGYNWTPSFPYLAMNCISSVRIFNFLQNYWYGKNADQKLCGMLLITYAQEFLFILEQIIGNYLDRTYITDELNLTGYLVRKFMTSTCLFFYVIKLKMKRTMFHFLRFIVSHKIHKQCFTSHTGQYLGFEQWFCAKNFSIKKLFQTSFLGQKNFLSIGRVVFRRFFS